MRESDRHVHVVAALRYLVDESVERDQDLLDSGLGVIQLTHGGLVTPYPTPAKHRLRRFGSMKMTDRDSDTLDRIGRAMMKAWSRLKRPKRKEWSEWMIIGEGLLEGRRWAMQVANVNRPQGKGYGTAFNEWLRRYKVDDMDKSDRAKLLRLMEQRPAIEEWRGTLTTSERLNLNNPTLVWRRWTADTRVKNPRPRTAGVSATEHGRAQAMVQQLQARTEELERELVSARQSIDEVSLDDLLRATAAKLKPMSRSDQESALGRLRDMLPPEEDAAGQA